jgi:hypothetical protein
MLCTVTVTGVWQLVAQYYELNVASGQSLVGSIIGFSLVVAGKDSVIWVTPDPKSFPPYKVRARTEQGLTRSTGADR